MSTIRVEQEDFLNLLKDVEHHVERQQELINRCNDQLTEIRAYRELLAKQGFDSDELKEVVEGYKARFR